MRRGTRRTRTLLLSLTDWSDIAISSDGGGGRVRLSAFDRSEEEEPAGETRVSTQTGLDAPFLATDRC